MLLHFLRENVLDLRKALFVSLHFRICQRAEVFAVCTNDKERPGDHISVQAAPRATTR